MDAKTISSYLEDLFVDPSFISQSDLSELDGSEVASYETDSDDIPKSSLFGYPSRPLCHEIGNAIYRWILEEDCKYANLPNYDLLDEQGYDIIRGDLFRSLTLSVEGLFTLWNDWSEEERKHRLKEILLKLGKRGLLDLLTVRKTAGTVEVWPPSRKTLMENFNTSCNWKTLLTVGARALAKHHHRDGSTSWWGSSVGTEAQKNEHALQTANKILDSASWINIHQIVHGDIMVEIRQDEGYGVRWTYDGLFRGFLEPQMEDGHDVGWKH